MRKMAPQRRKRKTTPATKKERLLAKIYYDPAHPAGYASAERLFQAQKRSGRASRAAVREWLSGQETYTLHRPARKRYPRRKTIAGHLDYQWQADLLSVQNIKKYNDGRQYLLTVIDVFSRQAFAEPLKNKTGPEVAKTLENLFRREKRQPKYFHTDFGREFKNAHVNAVLKKRNIRDFATNSEIKAALVERFNRTLKTRMYKYFTKKRTFRFLDVLPQLVASYNNAKHRSLKMAPNQVNAANQLALWKRLYGEAMPKKRAKFAFQLGDTVRLSQTPRMFEKGFEPRYTREYYIVSYRSNTKPPTYKVRDMRGELVDGSFYEPELQRIQKPKEDQPYDVDILRKRQRNKKNEYFVHFKGWPSTYDQWVSAGDLEKPK
jgi:hypothetical protein